MNKTLFRILVLALVCVLATVPAMAETQGDGKKGKGKPPPPAPSFVYYTLLGYPVSLIFDVPGERTLVHFWATWCAPCVRELPILNGLAKRKPANLRIITISLDDNPALVTEFFRRRNIDALTPYYDKTGQAMRVLKVGGLPTTVYLDDAGKELNRYVGEYDWTLFNSGAALPDKL